MDYSVTRLTAVSSTPTQRSGEVDLPYLALVMLLPAVAGLAGLGWFIWEMSSAGLI